MAHPWLLTASLTLFALWSSVSASSEIDSTKPTTRMSWTFGNVSTPANATSASIGSGTLPSSLKALQSSTSTFTGNSSHSWVPWSLPAESDLQAVPKIGNGSAFASNCMASSLYYISRSYLWEDTNEWVVTSTSVSVATETVKATTEFLPFKAVWNSTTACDGFARLPATIVSETYNRWFAKPYTVRVLSPPITTVTSRTISYKSNVNDAIFTSLAIPNCMINYDDCQSLEKAWNSSWTLQTSSWSSTNQAFLSLASPPDFIVVNQETTTFPPGAITAPSITVHGETYTALPGSEVSYSISNATNLQHGLLLTPGGEVTANWDLFSLETTTKYLPCSASWRAMDDPTQNITTPDVSECSRTADCTITAASVELIYFAPPSTSRDICENTRGYYNQHSVSIYSQPHSSTVLNGNVYWSDSVYLSYNSVWAHRSCENGDLLPAGSTHHGSIITIASSKVSSVCYRVTKLGQGLYDNANSALDDSEVDAWRQESTQLAYFTAYPFNFKDLVGPVPYSAYTCATWGTALYSSIRWHELGTDPEPTETIFEYLYQPRLQVPDLIRNLDPAWKDCALVLDGTYDPPRAMGTASVLADPTSTHALQSQTAEPAKTAEDPGARKTAAPTKPMNSIFDPPSVSDPDATEGEDQKPDPSPTNGLGGGMGGVVSVDPASDLDGTSDSMSGAAPGEEVDSGGDEDSEEGIDPDEEASSGEGADPEEDADQKGVGQEQDVNQEQDVDQGEVADQGEDAVWVESPQSSHNSGQNGADVPSEESTQVDNDDGGNVANQAKLPQKGGEDTKEGGKATESDESKILAGNPSAPIEADGSPSWHTISPTSLNSPIPIQTVAGKTVAVDPNDQNGVIISESGSSEKLNAGDSRVYSDTTISLDPTAGLVIAAPDYTSTQPLPLKTNAAPIAIQTIGGKAVMFDPTESNDPAVFIMDNSGAPVTLKAGTSEILDDTTFSFDPTAGLIVSGPFITTTNPLPTKTQEAALFAPLTAGTIGDKTILISPTDSNVILIKSPSDQIETLKVGESHIYSDSDSGETTISLNSPGNLVILHSGTTSTLTLLTDLPQAGGGGGGQAFHPQVATVIGSHILSINPLITNVINIDDKKPAITLSSGQQRTVSDLGLTMSENEAGSLMIWKEGKTMTQTLPLPKAWITTKHEEEEKMNIGEAIVQGLEAYLTATTTAMATASLAHAHAAGVELSNFRVTASRTTTTTITAISESEPSTQTGGRGGSGDDDDLAPTTTSTSSDSRPPSSSSESRAYCNEISMKVLITSMIIIPFIVIML